MCGRASIDHFIDKVGRPAFGFFDDDLDILADYAHRKQLHAVHKYDKSNKNGEGIDC